MNYTFTCRTPYRFLRGDQRNLIAEPQYRVERHVFIDCLAALHDMAAASGSDRESGCFSIAQVEAIFTRACHWTLDPLAGLRQNLEINFKTAGDLGSCSGEIDVRQFADDYVDSVIRQYQILRTAEATLSGTTTSQFSF
ncbi:MAG: hypothetical protein M3Z23_07355 [Acidobacteriota bacterium]|nr:hypothetical protein [Acidobacteriota bacterium]